MVESFLNGVEAYSEGGGDSSVSQETTRGIIQGETNSQMLFSLFNNNSVTYIKLVMMFKFVLNVICFNAMKTKAISLPSKENLRKLNYDLLPKIIIGGDDIE